MAKKKKKTRTKAKIDASKTFEQHGVEFNREVGDQAIGVCPFCASQKFYVNKDNGRFDCKVCGVNGGHWKFLNLIIPFNQDAFKGRVVRKLAKDRGLQSKTFRDWGVGWNGSQYTFPVDACGKLMDLRHCYLGGKMHGTTNCKVSLVGPKPTDDSVLWLCEGEWDAMACWEATKGKQNVLAMTGASSFPQHCIELVQNRDVRVIMDHDKAGFDGGQRLFRMLQHSCSRLRFVHWPSDTKKGYDFRDCYLELGDKAIEHILPMMEPLPPGIDSETEESLKVKVPTGPGLSPGEVETRFRKWLRMPNTDSLHVLYGSVLANRLDGDPIWLFLVAPPGSLKTELIMSMADAPLIVTTTSLTPHVLISGFPSAGGGDPSLIPKLNGKVLTIKDFTTSSTRSGQVDFATSVTNS